MFKKFPLLVLSLIMLSSLVSNHVEACDICKIYIPHAGSQGNSAFSQGFRVGVAEQFTKWNTVYRNGMESTNPFNEYVDSSITQFYVGYDLTDRLGIQVNMPYIARKFQRVRGTQYESTTEQGLGDVTMSLRFQVFNETYDLDQDEKPSSKDFNTSWSIYGGPKFPTGDTNRLSEVTGMMPMQGNQSSVHGHFLTLGTGSFDGFVGSYARISWWKLYFQGDAQYTFRTTGDFQYEYGNDLTWIAGPGIFIPIGEENSLTFDLNFSGMAKNSDFNGAKSVVNPNSEMTYVYFGPGVSLNFGKMFSFSASGDFPIHIEQSGGHIAPDWRINGGLNFHFPI